MKIKKEISKLTLKYHNLQIEEKYQNHIKNDKMEYLVVILLIIQLINFFFLYIGFKNDENLSKLKLYTFIVIFLPFLSIILLVIKSFFTKLEILFDISIYFIYSVVTQNMTVILLFSINRILF
jgi:hypothetical protein